MGQQVVDGTTPLISIAEVVNHLGAEVEVQGWVHKHTDKGRLQFILVRDGTGVLQAVAFKQDLSPEEFEAACRLTQESSLRVRGTVKADDRAPGGFEMGLTALEVVGASDPDYPLQPKTHGIGFLMENRPLWIRAPRQAAILRSRATAVRPITARPGGHRPTHLGPPLPPHAAAATPGCIFTHTGSAQAPTPVTRTPIAPGTRLTAPSATAATLGEAMSTMPA